MSEVTSKQWPRIDLNSPKAAPTILTIGTAILRGIAWWQDIDFILSVREEKIAMALQLLLDWGWLILVIVGIVWILGAHEVPTDQAKVHWGMVTSVGILTFLIGTLITVRAIGTPPMMLTGWGGDPNARNCSATIDTSRLIGRKEKDRLILLCGVYDPTQDPMEDDRIAVSRPFTISGQPTTIVAAYGAMQAAVDDLIPRNQGFVLWHSVAVVPKDLNVSEIKRVSDVAKRGGKVITEPQAGAYGNAMPNLALPTSPAISPPKEQSKKP